MITCHQIKGTDDFSDIHVDHNHDGRVILKQHGIPEDDWIEVDARMLGELIAALVDVQNKGHFLDD